MFAIEKMCRVLKVSRSGFYHWVNRIPSCRELENTQYMDLIKQEHKNSKGRYGSPKITEVLKAKGYRISRPRVARLMKKAQIRSIIKKKYKVATTDSKHSYPIPENLLQRNFKSSRPGQVWVSDITYIPTAKGWVYLTVIIDLFDRKVVGWSLSDSMTTKETIVAAWNMAIINRPINDGELLFHSDRGVQYACSEFREFLALKKVKQSMSRKGNCWDNAVAENFFKILKSELVYHVSFFSKSAAKLEIFEFIEIWYNRKRKHSVLGYRSPEEYSNQQFKYAA